MEYITEKDRIYALDSSGKLIAEVTFPTKDGVASINHTYVDTSLRGQGIAGELMKLATEKILADGKKIKAICPYAVDWLRKNPLPV